MELEGRDRDKEQDQAVEGGVGAEGEARLWGTGTGCCLNPAYRLQDLLCATEFSQLSPLSCELEVNSGAALR